MRTSYIIDAWTSVHIKDIIRIGGKINETYEGVICRENFKANAFKGYTGKLYDLKKKKNQGDKVMELLVKFRMKSLFGELIGKDTEEEYACKSE